MSLLSIWWGRISLRIDTTANDFVLTPEMLEGILEQGINLGGHPQPSGQSDWGDLFREQIQAFAEVLKSILSLSCPMRSILN